MVVIRISQIAGSLSNEGIRPSFCLSPQLSPLLDTFSAWLHYYFVCPLTVCLFSRLSFFCSDNERIFLDMEEKLTKYLPKEWKQESGKVWNLMKVDKHVTYNKAPLLFCFGGFFTPLWQYLL